MLTHVKKPKKPKKSLDNATLGITSREKHLTFQMTGTVSRDFQHFLCWIKKLHLNICGHDVSIVNDYADTFGKL